MGLRSSAVALLAIAALALAACGAARPAASPRNGAVATATPAVEASPYSASSVWAPLRRSLVTPLLTRLRPLCPPSVLLVDCAGRPEHAQTFAPVATYFQALDRVRCLRATPRESCVEQVMREYGATPDAVAFYRETKEWLLTDFREHGRVDVGIAFNPWRANQHTQWVLLNSSPTAWFPERSKDLDISQDPAYRALLGAFPAQANAVSSTQWLIAWPSDYAFEAEAPRASGQRFVFQFKVTNSCRVCTTGYFARIAFDVAADGRMQATTLIGVCRGPDATVEVADIASCPPPAG